MPHCVHLASDLHLGAPNREASHERERRFVTWLREAAEGTGFAEGAAATEIHVVGDVFDFWFEYRHSVPKGGVRVLGALAELADGGLPVHFHVGNHDLWTFGYLENEVGVAVHRAPVRATWDGLTCLVGHGDGLGPGDHGYKRLKRLFTSRICQAAFRRVHPDLGIALANRWSAASRRKGELPVTSVEQEHLYQHALHLLQTEEGKDVDAFVFGHRHAPLDVALPGGHSRYLNLGDWISHFTSAVVKNGQISLVHHG
jgi:UDP-2,3-diacylglucosamine hydrolase